MFRSLRISHVEFWFPGSENLGPSRNGRMERNFPVIPILRNFRPTSRGTPKISEWNSGKCVFHSLPNPEFPEFLVEWKAPSIFLGRRHNSCCTHSPQTRSCNKNGGVLELFSRFRRGTENRGFIRIKKFVRRSISTTKYIHFSEKKFLGLGAL